MITISIIKYVGTEQVNDEVTYDLPITFEQMDELHREYSDANPDCWVNMAIDQGSFICGMREQQRVDEQLLDLKLITWDEYYKRSYSK